MHAMLWYVVSQYGMVWDWIEWMDECKTDVTTRRS